jgi:type I restriction enzyme M protein
MSYAKHYFVDKALEQFNFHPGDKVSDLLLVFTALCARKASVSVNLTVLEILKKSKAPAFVKKYFAQHNEGFLNCTLETFEKVTPEDMVEYLNQKIENRTLFSHDGTDATYFPQQMNDLCVKYLELKNTDTLLDLGSGVSSFLINAKKNYDITAAGVEIDESVCVFANILSSISGQEIQVWNEDVFNFSKLKQVEKLFSFPSFNMKIEAQHIRNYVLSKNIDGKDFAMQGEVAFILKALDLLSEKGRAVIAIFSGLLFKENLASFREYLVKNKYLEAVITLPDSVLINTNIPVALLVLSRNNDKVRFVNASSVHGKSRHGGSCLMDEHVAAIYEMSKKKNHNAVDVKVEKIGKDGYCLLPSSFLLEAKLPFADEAVEYRKLSELVTQKIYRGVQYKASVLDTLLSEEDSDFYYFSSKDIQENRIAKNLQHMSEISQKDLSLILKNDDILLVLAITDNIKVAVVSGIDKQKILPASNLYVIRPDTSLILPMFFKLLLESESAKTIFKEFSAGSALRTISAEFLNNLLIPVPPLAVQQKLIKKYSEIEAEQEKLKTQLEALSQKKKELIEASINGD